MSPDPLPSLASNPCLQRCCWRGTGLVRGEEPLFRCTSCGSEWVRSQPWAPVDCDGSRDAALDAELARRPDRPPHPRN